MIRLAWRQFRAQAALAAGLLAVVAVVLAITGPRLAHRYHTARATCPGPSCGAATNAFIATYHFLQAGLNSAVLVLPVLIGIFWGAPLVARELETGTFRLAWTQSVTRNRWLITRIALAGLASMLVTGLFSLMVTWWSSPVDRVNLNRLTPAMFGERGLAPVGYAAFAFALGVAAGLLIRRTVPAMATTLVAFIGARLLITYWVRPHVLTPARTVSPLAFNNVGSSDPHQGDWVLSEQTLNRTGHVIGANGGIGPNGGLGFSTSHGTLSLIGLGPCPGVHVNDNDAAQRLVHPRVMQACVEHFHLREVLTYQPANRYWPLQFSELAIFLALAVLLAGLCVWRTRRIG